MVRCIGLDNGVQCTNTNAHFNFPGLPQRFCGKHKTQNMVDVNSKRCKGKNEDGTSCVSVHPTFNIEGKSGEFCGKHKTDKMIDVMNKRCEGNDDGIPCKITGPAFNFLGEKGRFCDKHKEDGMINVRSKRCEGKNEDGSPCLSICPKFNTEGMKGGRYCEKHKDGGMVDVMHSRCKEGCGIIVTRPTYDGYCMRCFINKFPDVKISRIYRVKEQHVSDFISASFGDLVILFDRKIEGGCSQRRPDVHIDCGTHIIIQDTDENQHNTDKYCSCEDKRIMILFRDGGSIPLVVIRFNPDGYKDAKGDKHPSCFKYHKTLEVPIVSDKETFDKRLEVLRQRIQYHIDNIPEREITVEHLFYNGFHSIKS